MFGLVSQDPQGFDGPRVSWAWIFGTVAAVLSAIIIGGMRLVWKGAMSELETRIARLEDEVQRLRDVRRHR